MAGGTRRIPGIPAIAGVKDPAVAAALTAIKENVEIREGVRRAGTGVGDGSNFDGWKRRNVTLGMLVKAGILTEVQARELYPME